MTHFCTMEAEDDEEIIDGNEDSRIIFSSGVKRDGGGDEGGEDEQFLQINRLQQHVSSEKSFNRQMVGRILVEMFRAAVNNKITLIVEEVMQLVQLVIDDNDALVRLDLVEQIPNVAIICHEAPHLFGHVVRNYLLDIVMKYLNDQDNQVRLMAQSALTMLMKRGLLDNDTIENRICPTIEKLSYMWQLGFRRDMADEHTRNANISLMCRLAPLIGSELTEKVFLPRYLDLCEDNDMMVRRICATHFGEMCIAVGKEKLYSKLIPMFIDLCGDRIWNVRKACVEVMMPVSCCLTAEHRRLLLADILAKHLIDDSKWVRISAFQILGPFISTFAKQFAEVTYNKNGELVYISKQDNHPSICYSYEGIFPMKSAFKNQISDMDEDMIANTKYRYNTKSPFYLPVMNVRHEDVKVAEEDDSVKEDDYQKTELDCSKSWREKIHQYKIKKETREAEKYNPFLYYYISPDIPLDDELTHAARQSAMNRNNVPKTAETEQNSTEENSSSCSSENPVPVVNSNNDNSNMNELLNDDSNVNVYKITFFSKNAVPYVNSNRDDSNINEQSNDDSNVNVLEMIKFFDKQKEKQDDDKQKEKQDDDKQKEKQNDECISPNPVYVDGDKRPRIRKHCLKILREKYEERKNLEKRSLEKKFYIYDEDSMSKSDESCKNLNAKHNKQEIVPQELINYYVSMANPNQAMFMGSSIDIPHYCAFSFPAVVLTLGKENWHYLKKAYQSLSSAKHWRVRRTLASSIHEIAMILGEELTATDLVPIYDGFIKDLDEVRIGVLKHFATFLKILKPVDRCQYLSRLSDFLATDNEWNWRFREELATQLLEIVSLFSPSDVAQSIAPLSFQLLVDKVAAVRTIALELITRIMCYLSNEDALVMSLIHELRETLVLDAKKWIHRQTYALVCAHLIRNNAIPEEKFSKEMLPCLISLSCDKVPNVRLAVARTIATDVIAMGVDNLGIDTMEEVERILTKMRLDVDRDVRVLAGGEEQQINILAYCSSDENNQVEQARNILF
ncbi:PREDICTED: serine/threonine-protein phosphatase 4 regulatory subunit 1-like isoform X3 [Trachymyrmex septentrionalis]|uniref:serine/threonine-protein phosphatase 4 regulatory subunit 1-like isoform X3 n=1 Tax=Trachymyrmex septentrionalis TaxID=34720 RepID=UPI00084F587F|nr:PREDICTED: serine/threonine-protein phosphatase 4 regulatory subunit 1-like isoform X3 [Trachymyrmex septentrionalis]